MKGRVFSNAASYHVYLRCADCGVLFYTLEDRIVYYTLAASKARIHGIRVSAASFMFTHLHISLFAPSELSLRSFLHGTNSSFSRLYNNRYQRTGRLFDTSPKYSRKVTSKAIRSNIIYVFNNHVEKGLCPRAEEERWSFLAYATSDHPFSTELIRSRSSRTLQKALNLVDRRIIKGKALEYSDLDKVIPALSPSERDQYVDYVITHYALIDYLIAISHFGSLESMILAIDSTTGGEYEIKEDFSKLKDTGYLELLEVAGREGYLRKLYSMTESEKLERVVDLIRVASAHPDHLRRFFHCNFQIRKR